MPSSSRNVLLARAFVFSGLSTPLIDPLSRQLSRLVTVLVVVGLGISSVLNLTGEFRPVFLVAPLLVVLFLSLEMAGDQLDGRSRLTLLATLIGLLGLAPTLRFETLFAGTGPFMVSALLLAIAWGTRAALGASLSGVLVAFMVLHPWQQAEVPAEPLVTWFLVSGWAVALIFVAGLVLNVWNERAQRVDQLRNRMARKVGALQKMVAGVMATDSSEPRHRALIRAATLDRMLSDNRLRLAAEGHLAPSSVESIDLFTWQRLFDVVREGLARNPETRHVQLHVINGVKSDEAVLADTGRIVAVINGLAQNAVGQRQAKNLWVTVKSEATAEGRVRCSLRLEDDGDLVSGDVIQQMLLDTRARKHATNTSEVHLAYVGQWIRDLGSAPLFGMSKFGGRAIGFSLSVDTVSIGTTGSRTSPPMVLVVDDDAAQRVSLKRMIEASFGAQVVAVATAAEGLKTVEEIAIDIVVTDYYMPEVDGAELTRTLRDRGQRMPVVAVTVANTGEQQESLWNSGVDLVVPKPVSAQALSGAMQRFVAA